MMRLTPIALLIALATLGFAQGYRVAVIATAASPQGTAQSLAATRTAAALAAAGVFGRPLEIVVHDDGGDPARAVALAQRASDAGVHAVVCCSDPAAEAAVAGALEARMVPYLTLASSETLGGFWGVSLAVSERDTLTALAVDATRLGKRSLAWMAPDGAAGDAAHGAFLRATADAAVAIAGEARYPADATALTPEGLWIATREPGAVVVWGGDVRLALAGLRTRGYEGIVYTRVDVLTDIRWTLADDRDGRWTANDGLKGIRAAASPAAFPDLLPAGHPHAPAVAGFEARIPESRTRSAAERSAMAQIDDALVWLQRAFEEVAALPLTLSLTGERLALRDALIAAPPLRLANGTYDAAEMRRQAAHWSGLAIVEPLH